MTVVPRLRQEPPAEASLPSKKRSVANTVVKEKYGGEEMEVKEDGMPTQEHLLQMLGMSNTLVGSVNNFKELTTSAGEYCDSDTLTNLGFANIQIGGTSRDTSHED